MLSRRTVWEVAGNRIERMMKPRRESTRETWYFYRCSKAGETIFEAESIQDVIFKYRYYFDRGEL